MLTTYDIILKLFLGTLLGGIIGFERQTHGRPAGFRTQLLVCVSCVLLMIISEGYYRQGALSPELMRIDPTRIAAGAMTGVGFLGAGVILKTGASIQGLTTAACVWIVSAIGLAIGAGQYVAGIAGFIITFVSLWLLRILETRMPMTVYKFVTLVTDNTGDEKTVRRIFEEHAFEITKMDYVIAFPEKERIFMFTIAGKHSTQIGQIIETLSGMSFVTRVEIRS
jgi:putative Mg2+ transporter-C (MgtC) family protein